MDRETLNEKASTNTEIAERIEAVSIQIADQFKTISPATFFRMPPTGWSPALNLNHLIKAAIPISITLASPKMILLPMGKSRKESRDYKGVVKAYQHRLANGATAGIFVPLGKPTGDEGKRNKLIEKFKNVYKTYTGRILKWTDSDSDKYRMPHPILGMLTVKEMLYFSLYHLGHHAKNVEKRFGLN